MSHVPTLAFNETFRINQCSKMLVDIFNFLGYDTLKVNCLDIFYLDDFGLKATVSNNITKEDSDLC